MASNIEKAIADAIHDLENAEVAKYHAEERLVLLYVKEYFENRSKIDELWFPIIAENIEENSIVKRFDVNVILNQYRGMEVKVTFLKYEGRNEWKCQYFCKSLNFIKTPRETPRDNELSIQGSIAIKFGEEITRIKMESYQ